MIKVCLQAEVPYVLAILTWFTATCYYFLLESLPDAFGIRNNWYIRKSKLYKKIKTNFKREKRKLHSLFLQYE